MSVSNAVQFTATANATNVSLSIVSQLAPFVTVTPTAFSTITSGQIYEIRISTSIPVGTPTPSIFRGTLHLVSKARTVANPFEIVLLVDVAAARDVRTEDIISDSPGVYYSNNQLILTLKPGYGLTDATLIANSIGGQVVGIVPSINSYQLELPSHTIDALDAAIAYVTQVYESVVEFATKHTILGVPAVDNDLLNLRALNSSFTAAYDKVRVQPAWTFLDSLGPLPLTVPSVADIDTGIDPTHSEFAGVNLGSVPRDLLQDFTACGHGTQVAGIIGANNLSATSPYIPLQMNGIIAGVPHIGAGYTMEIRPSVQPAPFGIWASIDSAIRSHGAQIMMVEVQLAKCSALSPQQIQSGELNCSSSSSDFEDDKRRWFRVISSYPEVLWILPAGNYGIPVQIVAREIDPSNEFPAGISPPSNNTITVGATDLSDARAIWDAVESSDFGAGVTIAAPGSNVYAPVPLSAPSDPNCRQYAFIGNAYLGSFQGTSASGPFVAGASATLKAIEKATPSRTLSPQQIKDILITSADSITTDKPIGPRLNILRAVQQALNPPTGPRITSIVPPSAAAGFGQMIAVSGNSFPDLATWATDRPRVLFAQGSTSAQGFLFLGSPFPTPSMLFVRLPFIGDGFTTTGLVPGAASVAVIARNGSSNSFPLTVSTTPGKPSARFAMMLNAAPTPADPCGSSLQSSAPIAQIKAGQGIGVSAFGIDTGGSLAIFTQGNTSIDVGPSLCGFSGSDFGVANAFAVPTSLVPGTVSISIKTFVDGVASLPSDSITLTVVP